MKVNVLGMELSADDYQSLLWGAIIAALVSFYIFVRHWKRLRLVEDTPTSRLRSAHQGYIELEGRGQHLDETIFAPLSNHPCLWYRSLIERHETYTENGRSKSRWNVIYGRTSSHRFRLIDGESSCYVDPDGAEVNGHEKLVWYGDTEWPTQTQLLESQSVVKALTNHYRYSEWLILPGQLLYILGQFTTCSAAAGQPVRKLTIDLLNDWKNDRQSLLQRFDSNKDGQIDLQEWEAVRQSAFAEAQQVHDRLAQEPDIHLVEKPAQSGQPFIISVHPQAVLIDKYRRTAYGALLVCLILIAIVFGLLKAPG